MFRGSTTAVERNPEIDAQLQRLSLVPHRQAIDTKAYKVGFVAIIHLINEAQSRR